MGPQPIHRLGRLSTPGRQRCPSPRAGPRCGALQAQRAGTAWPWRPRRHRGWGEASETPPPPLALPALPPGLRELARSPGSERGPPRTRPQARGLTVLLQGQTRCGHRMAEVGASLGLRLPPRVWPFLWFWCRKVGVPAVRGCGRVRAQLARAPSGLRGVCEVQVGSGRPGWTPTSRMGGRLCRRGCRVVRSDLTSPCLVALRLPSPDSSAGTSGQLSRRSCVHTQA